MKKLLIYLSILCFVICTCQSKKEETHKNNKTSTMVEKFDFALFKKYQESNGTLELKNGYTVLSMSAPEKDEAGTLEELLPKPSFLYVYKEFYPNGNLKKKETRISETVKVEKSEYYDKDGNLEKTVDEDQNYGKIKYQDVLSFLDKKGYINLKTGEGRLNDDGTNKYDIVYDQDVPVWNISITQGKRLSEKELLEIMKTSPGEPNVWKPVVYKMDANTGKIISEK
ncbi:hypothetical protein BBH99_02890 [Chryseobacterium contaminans]|uniref:Uncharacterized protein n=1 Tax=Chryseobacterium contaminans TaxID=1423959 RepID=A0A1M7HAA9_9FLAO|nr:hypothetical protein [Chryseobacterium contaminans]OCA72681.1 hypothetical protein BBH99_02890 [Chryseobacterium contaminans]SHM25339.1 hypothetical protein SAMN05444407_111144 [Chryseobacterium contaminans]